MPSVELTHLAVVTIARFLCPAGSRRVVALGLSCLRVSESSDFCGSCVPRNASVEFLIAFTTRCVMPASRLPPPDKEHEQDGWLGSV